ncbi:hypothetical protein LXA43DRAFT_466621 [Ganoderma leucocontextum]|nr:hypothetical protein LXA43DRAFT_466621 [Ganoderma leucocontextum]
MRAVVSSSHPAIFRRFVSVRPPTVPLPSPPGPGIIAMFSNPPVIDNLILSQCVKSRDGESRSQACLCNPATSGGNIPEAVGFRVAGRPANRSSNTDLLPRFRYGRVRGAPWFVGRDSDGDHLGVRVWDVGFQGVVRPVLSLQSACSFRCVSCYSFSQPRFWTFACWPVRTDAGASVSVSDPNPLVKGSNNVAYCRGTDALGQTVVFVASASASSLGEAAVDAPQ